MINRLAFLSLSLLALAACGDDSGPSDISVFDSGPPDAAPQPDAAPCAGELCDGICVDTTSDSLNCGGCGLACDSPGQICSGQLPCACPPDFVPANVGTSSDQIQMQQGAFIGLTPLFGQGFNVFISVWDLSLETGVEYDFADSIANFSPPAFAAGYEVDIASFTAKTSFAAFEGTVVFDTICDTGASGTISNVVLSEVLGVANPTPVEGGCSMSLETLNFDVGSCPAETPDGGLPDAGTPDAGN